MPKFERIYFLCNVKPHVVIVYVLARNEIRVLCYGNIAIGFLGMVKILVAMFKAGNKIHEYGHAPV
jgi:hypothetical protein